MSGSDKELDEQWLLINTPLGQEWSGRARYAAAMYFNIRGEMSAEALEIYRICSRMDWEDPLAILKSHNIGNDWLARIDRHQRGEQQ
ncbi:hypothetical protein [Phyllobacterium lublinensis]|uniref:hypothetical protein n=1 Tax=Phyllobacterium lublinensis TaxID=2875708 RepID=UPI001CC91BC2|nr:hypothetical protein [Phyllobacterium sp. 2063]MBZ9657134.1 hypothetical protein [Phyllobacterium sp. 2063]